MIGFAKFYDIQFEAVINQDFFFLNEFVITFTHVGLL